MDTGLWKGLVGVATILALVGPALGAEGPRPLTLREAVEIALEKSPLLRAAALAVDAAGAEAERARAGFLPRLDVSEGYTRSNNPFFAFGAKLDQGRFTQDDFALDRLNRPDPLGNFRTSFSLVQSLFQGGRILNGYEQARLDRAATEQVAGRQRQEVIFQVARSYYRLLLAQEELAVTEAAVKAAEANADLARARYEAGLVVESDLLSARVRLAALRQQEIAARNEVPLARSALNDAIGLPLETGVTTPEKLELRPERHPPGEDLEGLALQKRPDYRQVSLQEQALERALASARGAYLPSIDARAAYELNHFHPVTEGQDNWSVGVVLQWNAFNGGADRARVAEARANLERTRALRQRLRSAIGVQVREASLHLRTARERVSVAETAVAQAEESLRMNRDRYEAGLTTIVDLLASEAALTQARGNLAWSLYDYGVGLAALELSLGTLERGIF